MATWSCPVGDFTAQGSKAEVEKQKRQHMEQTRDDPQHQIVKEEEREEEDYDYVD